MSKAPLNLDWDDLLSSKGNEAAPDEVEIVQSSANQGRFAHLSDRQVQGQYQRSCAALSSNLRDKLPDKGAKLQSSVLQLQAELDRRKLDVERSQRPRVSEANDSPGLHNDSSPCTERKLQQSSFASLFSKKLEEKADPPEPNRGWVSIERDKCEISKRGGRRLHEYREPTMLSSQPARTSSRSSPFQCASSLADKGDCRVIEPSPVGRNFFNRLSKRKASENNRALNPRSKKVQDVVLLDEEVEPNQPLLGDASDDGKEVRIYYPSRDDAECIELSYSDIKCLDPEQYLISPIMNFYIRYLQKPTNALGQPRGEYHFFNTYFFKKLEEAISCKSDKDARFLKLRRWWKGVNIFKKAYIFLPIHGDMHWSLVIICIPAKEDESGPIVLHLDSLGMHPSDSILDIIYEMNRRVRQWQQTVRKFFPKFLDSAAYLKEEWNYINKNGPPPNLPIAERIWSSLPSRIEKKKLRVPQQKNEYDCGLFVLYFMERFIDEAPERLKMKDLAMFGSRWFKPEEASGLRKRIRDLLVEEFENARLEKGRGQESPTSFCHCPDDDDDNDDDVQPLIEI